MRLDLIHPHRLVPAALRASIEARVTYWQARYPRLHLHQHYQWDTASQAHASYRGADGLLTLTTDALRVQIDLPFFAAVYRDRIESFVRAELAAVTSAVSAEAEAAAAAAAC